MSAYFITGTGTGIGKTMVTAALCRQLQKAQKPVHALKPIITGYREANSDTAVLLESLGLPLEPKSIERLSPWRFASPVSPDLAARQENRVMNFNAVVSFTRESIKAHAGVTLIEGIGGVMVPLDGSHTVLDWMAALNISVILVTGSYLGTLSHTLTAYLALTARRIPVAAIVVNESKDSPPSDTIDTLKRFIAPEVKFAFIPRLNGPNIPWQQIPDLTHLV